MPKKRTLQERDYLTVASMAASGARHIDVARRLGMNHETWQRIREENPKALEAFEAGRSELHEELASILINKAREGNVPCLLFSLKIYYGYRENQPVPIQHHHRVTIELPQSLTPEQYEALGKLEAPKDTKAMPAEVVPS